MRLTIRQRLTAEGYTEDLRPFRLEANDKRWALFAGPIGGKVEDLRKLGLEPIAAGFGAGPGCISEDEVRRIVTVHLDPASATPGSPTPDDHSYMCSLHNPLSVRCSHPGCDCWCHR